ncbi:MAG: glycosyltransferase [Candidatus Margulisiibacteriota bacterium]
MKVLQVVKHYYPYRGGVESYTREVVLGLKDIPGLSLEVLTANEARETVEEKVDGVPVTRVASFGEKFSVPLCPTFPYWLRQKPAEIKHFQMPFPLAEFAELLGPKKSKLVVSWHSDIVKQVVQRKLYEPFLRRFLDRADKILVATPHHITSSLFLPDYKEKCAIVPYGIDPRRFSAIEPDDPKVLALRGDAEFVILFVGRLVYYKGVEFLIRAMTEVNGKLLIIGDGPLKEELAALIATLGLQEKVRILPNVGDEALPYYYQACDLFVLPSIANSEAFGIVQVEAMACGKPVITTDLPTGVTYVNQRGVTGLVVPIKDSLALAKAINELRADPQKRQFLGENGRQRANTLYNKANLGPNVYRIYQEVLR